MTKPFAAAFGVVLNLFLPHCSWGATEVATNSPTNRVHIPIEFRHGDLMVPVKVNDSNSLTFKLDSGFGVTTVHPDLVESLQLRPTGRLRIEGIAGEERATVYTGATFDFGGTTYSPRRVAVIPSEAQRRRRERDGVLGAGFFRRYVVELDPVRRTLTLHEPRQFNYAGKGEAISLEFRRDTPIVEAAINIPDRAPIRAKFEIDSGCDGELCLGHDFVETNALDHHPDSPPTESRYGVGGSVETRNGVLPQFQLGSHKLDKLPANFFLKGSPVDDGLAGHIGLNTLRKFRVIFDYSRRKMILEPLK
jgi:predicted aspartyl protease